MAKVATVTQVQTRREYEDVWMSDGRAYCVQVHYLTREPGGYMGIYKGGYGSGHGLQNVKPDRKASVIAALLAYRNTNA